MDLGLFGKLPARRDFVAVNVPRAFLDCWEPWMQASLAASRAALEGDWPAAYSSAPIWRFWLSPEICSEAILGAIMPSQDGIGRCYPLTLLASGDLASPEFDARDDWYAAGEVFLRATAGRYSQDYEGMLTELGRLASAPKGWPTDAPATRFTAWDVEAGSPPHPLEHLRVDDRFQLHQHTTVWWTFGNSQCPPQALASAGLPEPGMLTSMLTGDWSAFADGP